MKFKAGQQVVLLRWDRKVVNTTVVKTGRRWVEIDHAASQEKFDGETGLTPEKTGYGSRIYPLEEWAARQRNERASAALRQAGVDLHQARFSAVEFYDALKGLLGLPAEPPEEK